MPLISVKPTKRDDVAGMKCKWKKVYVAPRNFEELKVEVKELNQKWAGLVEHYHKEDAQAFAFLCLVIEGDLAKLIGKKDTAKRRKLAKSIMTKLDIGRKG